jgi:hypothetical protein
LMLQTGFYQIVWGVFYYHAHIDEFRCDLHC